MSIPSKRQKTFDALDRNAQRLCWLLDMHCVEFDWAEGLPPFVHRLQTDRHLAMDFWALVRSLRRTETAGLSDHQIIALVVSCVCGSNTLPWGHDDKAALAAFTSMLAAAGVSIDAANLPDAIAMPERTRNQSMVKEWPGALNQPEQPRIYEYEPGADDIFIAANPAANPEIESPAMTDMSQVLSHHLNEALSRLELTSLELKVHLDNLDSRMSRIEPHLEDITSLVASSLDAYSLSAFKPGISILETPSPSASSPSYPPEHHVAGVNRAVPMASPERELSWWYKASAWWSSRTRVGWPDKAKAAWMNRPQLKGRLPELPSHLLSDFKQRWLNSMQFVSARWKSVYPRHVAIVASVLVAGLAGGAILVNTHRHPATSSGTPSRKVKSTESPSGTWTGDAGGDATPLTGGSGDLQPSPPNPTKGEEIKADQMDGRNGPSTLVVSGTSRTDSPKKERASDFVAKPTFTWLGEDPDTSPQRGNKSGANNVPKAAVLGEKSAAPAPKGSRNGHQSL